MRAKLGKRAASVGFDWPDVAGVRAKVDEEIAELDAAAASGDRDEIAAEMGDLLFTIANWCRHLELDPETCLRAANQKFATRFRAVEQDVVRARPRLAELRRSRARFAVGASESSLGAVIKAVLFDLDGTLYDRDLLAATLFREQYAAFAHELRGVAHERFLRDVMRWTITAMASRGRLQDARAIVGPRRSPR